LSIAKAYFAGFHCCEKASADDATPISAIPAALASADTNKKGTPVVITLSCALASEIINKQIKTDVIFFIIVRILIKQI
jgi:hypothetical protein